jgi:hypothetical protein
MCTSICNDVVQVLHQKFLDLASPHCDLYENRHSWWCSVWRYGRMLWFTISDAITGNLTVDVCQTLLGHFCLLLTPLFARVTMIRVWYAEDKLYAVAGAVADGPGSSYVQGAVLLLLRALWFLSCTAGGYGREGVAAAAEDMPGQDCPCYATGRADCKGRCASCVLHTSLACQL